MDSYIGQTKTPLGVIFHYVNNSRNVESIYYTDVELVELGNNMSATTTGSPYLIQ